MTLDDLHTMVKQGEAFVVEDAKSGRDLTCSVLAQIISEEETKGHNMLPLNYLRQVLQAYDAGFGPQFRSYVEHSIDAFAANQKQVVEQMQSLFGGETSSAAVQQFVEFGRQNAEMFQRSMQLFTPPLGEAGKSSGCPHAVRRRCAARNERTGDRGASSATGRHREALGSPVGRPMRARWHAARRTVEASIDRCAYSKS